MTTKTDLSRIANLLAVDLDSLSEWEMARLVSDPGLIVQERQTGLRYAQEDEEMDAVAWLRDGNTLVLWAGNDADPDMNWPVEITTIWTTMVTAPAASLPVDRRHLFG